jgi:phosphatidylglycerophosphatase A
MARSAEWLATCFGLGKVSHAPGTVASAVATLCGVPLVLLGWRALLPAFIAITAIGIPACGAYARARRIHDPGDCVLDEVAGQWLALLPVAAAVDGNHWPAYLVAFLAFRLFDIWKPWPAWWAEQRLPGGIGIVADDVAAGVYAALVVFGTIRAGWV